MSQQPESTHLDRLIIADIIQRERNARDAGRWDEMASYYHPESSIEVSWFNGSGAEFVERSRRQAEKVSQSARRRRAYQLSRNGSGCRRCAGEIGRWRKRHARSTASFLSTAFPARRAAMCGCCGARCVQAIPGCLPDCGAFMFATIFPPATQIASRFSTRRSLPAYRLSYRYVTYNLARLGLDPRNDLPGADLPETVKALRDGERAWLAQQPERGA